MMPSFRRVAERDDDSMTPVAALLESALRWRIFSQYFVAASAETGLRVGGVDAFDLLEVAGAVGAASHFKMRPAFE